MTAPHGAHHGTDRVRRLALGGLIVTVAPLLLAACSSSPVRSSARKPLNIVPAPSHTIAITAPQVDGSFWDLSGTATVKTITRIDATSGHVLSVLGVSDDAAGIAESASGTLALATGAGAVGAVELRQASDGKLQATVPVDGPVVRIGASRRGDTLVALERGAGHVGVDVISISSHSVVNSIPVPSNAIDVTPTPDGRGFWVLLPGGTVEQFATTSAQPITEFSTGQPGSAVALSPDAQTLYVLRSGPSRANVAVVKLSTQAVRTVLPAPAASVAIAISADGRQLYAAASPGRSSNVQAFALPG